MKFEYNPPARTIDVAFADSSVSDVLARALAIPGDAVLDAWYSFMLTTMRDLAAQIMPMIARDGLTKKMAFFTGTAATHLRRAIYLESPQTGIHAFALTQALSGKLVDDGRILHSYVEILVRPASPTTLVVESADPKRGEDAFGASRSS